MNRYLSTATAAFTIATSVFCVTAHADQLLASAASRQTVQSQQVTGLAHQTVQPHGLTRKQVYDELVRAEKDGSLARINALYEGS